MYLLESSQEKARTTLKTKPPNLAVFFILEIMMTLAKIEPPVFVRELKSLLGITHTDTLRIKIRDGKVRAPDVKISNKTRYWYRRTLVKAGLMEAKNEK